MTRKKRSHTRGAVFLIGVFVLAGVTSLGRWVQAEPRSEPIHICSEIVYQGFVGVRKIVKIDSETLSKQEALHLDGLLQTAQFFSLPGVISSPKFDGCCDRGFPDFRITVEAANKWHTVTINQHGKCRQSSRTYAIAPLARSPSRASEWCAGEKHR